jgi:hypothetical protein
MTPDFSLVDRSKSRISPPSVSSLLPAARPSTLPAARRLAWRVQRGVIRLDTTTAKRQMAFASLAIAGDILGCETLLFGAYTFSPRR